MDIEGMVEMWLAAKAQLDSAKQSELSLRKMLANEIPFGDEKMTIQGEDFSLKVEKQYITTLDEGLLAGNRNALTDEELGCLKVKTTLSMSAYNKLPQHRRELLDECIIRKPGTPKITLKED